MKIIKESILLVSRKDMLVGNNYLMKVFVETATARTISLFLLEEDDRVDMEGHLRAGIISIEWWCCVLFELLKKVSLETGADQDPQEQLSERTVEICQHLIDIVGFDLLRLDLSYISAEKLQSQDLATTRNLLEIVIGIARELGLPQVQLPELPKMLPKKDVKQKEKTPIKTKAKLPSLAKSKSSSTAQLINDIPETVPTHVKPFMSLAQMKQQKRKEALQRQKELEKNDDRGVEFDRKPDFIQMNANGRVLLPHSSQKLINKMRDTYEHASATLSKSSSTASLPLTAMNDVDGKVKGSIDKYTELVNLILPGVEVPDSVKNQLLKHETSKIRAILQSAALDKKVSDIKARNDLKAAAIKLPELVEREIETEKRIEDLRNSKKSNQAIKNILHNRKLQTIRLEKFLEEAEQQTKTILARRKHEEERLVANMMKEALKIERDNLREAKQIQKQRDREFRKISQLQNESRKTYIRDQVDILVEDMRKLKAQEAIQQKEEIEIKRRMNREDKENLRYDIRSIRKQMKVDGTDLYFRELDTTQPLERPNERNINYLI